MPVRLDFDTPGDDSFIEDYGAPLDATGTPMDLVDVEEEERLDRALDGEGSDSDSDLDIHTPLPYVSLVFRVRSQIDVAHHPAAISCCEMAYCPRTLSFCRKRKRLTIVPEAT